MEKLNKIVESMRVQNKYVEICKREEDLLHKCILCRYYLSSNQWSLLLESHIKNLFNIEKAKDSTSGDGISRNGMNIEIKVSLGSDNGRINFVQIRPDHKIDYYLFLVYNLYTENIGSIHWLLCDSNELYKLLPEYGGYAHGSILQHNAITLENI